MSMKGIKQKNLISNTNLETTVSNILNECYREFVQIFGDKHSERIKSLIIDISTKIQKAPLFYSGPKSSANTVWGITYSDTNELSAILKHEMWHIFNLTAFVPELSYTYLSAKYKNILERIGYIRAEYEEKANAFKQRYRENPDIIKKGIISYESFLSNYKLGQQEKEKWTEWFNNQTHVKDMRNTFKEWDDGFFTHTLSAGSFYDAYTSIADMVSCLIPKDKLLDMHLNTGDYKTNYSYQDMINEFDGRYSEALTDDEKDLYEFPYLKILLDTKTIEENVDRNQKQARKALQSCMNICFRAYKQKLEGISNPSIEDAKQLFNEIKYMQDHMLWNVDTSKMQGLDYIQTMEQIQEIYKKKVSRLQAHSDIQDLLDRIDYKVNNQYELIPDGEKIAQCLINTDKSSNNKVERLGEYKVKIGKGGIKENLYRSISCLLGKNRFNSLFKRFADDNILNEFYEMIEKISSDDDIINCYNKIYELYAKKLMENLEPNKHISDLFREYSEEIQIMQENGPINIERKKLFAFF